MSGRETNIDGWGKALVEELLLQGAEQVSHGTDDKPYVEVNLTFRLTPDPSRELIEIRVPTMVESALVTTLSRPF